MKPTALDIQQQGDLGGEKILTRFDEDSIEFIMSVLTDLYSDPEMAVVREYSTNAWDSHIESGQTRPIEVTLPADLSPYLKIKDYGIGMSSDDIRNTYSAYGASTKRNTDTVVGMLGLGSKSAWTYTAQFTVVAVKGGVKTTVSANRTETGRTMLEIIDTCGTDEPNSVEIIVPAKPGNTFANKARRFFQFWNPDNVLVNQEKPFVLNGSPVGNRMMICDDLEGDYVVMGGVAYPVTGGLYPEAGYKKWGIVAQVGIGDVAFVPSREALNYNATTNRTIESLRLEFKGRVRHTITQDVCGAKTHGEAMTRWLYWNEKFAPIAKEVTYHGEQFKTQWQVPRDEQHTIKTWTPSRSRNAINNYMTWVEIASLQKNICIVNFPSDKISTYQRGKIREWAAQNSVTLTDRIYFFNAPKMIGSPWTDDIETVDWATIKAVRVASNGGGGTRSSGYRFKVVGDDGYWKDTDTLDTTKPILYFSPADYDEDTICSHYKGLADEIQVVNLTRNRWTKFGRDFPTGEHIYTWVKRKVDVAWAAITDEDKIILGLDSYDKGNLKRLDPAKIDDPEIVRFIQLANADQRVATPGLKDYSEALRLAQGIIGRSHNDRIRTVESPLKDYPLLQVSYKVHDHNYLYMNAVYADRQEKIRLEQAARVEAEMVERNFPGSLDEESAA
jgi:hypothetical protein